MHGHTYTHTHTHTHTHTQKRADSPPTKEKEREVDRNRINKRDMWTYARMTQVSKEELEREAIEDSVSQVLSLSLYIYI